MTKNITLNGHSPKESLELGSKIPGLEEAVRIVEARLGTAHACNYNLSYKAAHEDVLVFLRAELFRQRFPEQASYTTTD